MSHIQTRRTEFDPVRKINGRETSPEAKSNRDGERERDRESYRTGGCSGGAGRFKSAGPRGSINPSTEAGDLRG
jgi:hypothetical protein